MSLTDVQLPAFRQQIKRLAKKKKCYIEKTSIYKFTNKGFC